MRSQKHLIEQAAKIIVDLIEKRAGGTPPATPAAMQRLCRNAFGVPARPVNAPTEFYGQISGDIGGDSAMIVFNAMQPPYMQIRTLLHELAEYLAIRDMPALWDGLAGSTRYLYTGLDAPEELRHKVAVRVENILAKKMGIDDFKASWAPSEILRLIPLQPKYVLPRAEIERVPPEEIC